MSFDGSTSSNMGVRIRLTIMLATILAIAGGGVLQ